MGSLWRQVSFKIVGQSILSGFLGMALGMSLLLIALIVFVLSTILL